MARATYRGHVVEADESEDGWYHTVYDDLGDPCPQIQSEYPYEDQESALEDGYVRIEEYLHGIGS